MTMEASPLRVVVTGAAGQIGYSILQPIACGFAFGQSQPIHLVLFDIPICEEVLKGIQVELEDLASPVLNGTTIATLGETAFKDADYVICLSSVKLESIEAPRVMMAEHNKLMYEQQGKLLDKYAKKTVKVILVANPCNTMCLVMSHNAPSIPKENFSSLSRIDQNRAKGMIARKLGISTINVKKSCIWGNHSSTMVPDFSHIDVTMSDGKTNKIQNLIKDEKYWADIIPAVQQRGYLVVKYRKNSAALSTAICVIDQLRDWHFGTPENDFSCMGVYSDGSYNAPKGVFFSFPCICKNGKWSIVQDLPISDDIKQRLRVTGDELIKERNEIKL